MSTVDRPAASPLPIAGTDWFKICGLAFLAVIVVDVLSLFLAGIFHWEALLKLALAAFVYLQMGMTAASLGAFPVTLVMAVRRSFSPKAA